MAQTIAMTSDEHQLTSSNFLRCYQNAQNFQGQIQPFKQWRWALFHIESTSNATSEAAKVAVGSSAQVHINQIQTHVLSRWPGPLITWIHHVDPG